MKKHGFTLSELMVTIAITGLLTAVSVPKVSGAIAKAKASEITPAAGTYTKLQAAYLYENKSFGTWKKIGYKAPGKGGKTDSFVYTKEEVTSTIRTSQIVESLGNGKVSWQARNIVDLNGCKKDNLWKLKAVAVSETEIEFKSYIEKSATSSECAPLAGDWAHFQSVISMNTPPTDSPSSTDPSNTQVADAGNTNPSNPDNSNPGSNVNNDQNNQNDSNPVDNNQDDKPQVTAFYDAEENFTDEDDGSCGTMYTTGGNRCPPSWCKLNGNVSKNHGGWSGSNHKWNECFVARQGLIQEAASQGLLTCKNKNNCKVTDKAFASGITLNGNKVLLANDNSSDSDYDSAEAPKANSTINTSSELEAQAYFGYVEVLCAKKDTKKEGCSNWRRASECSNIAGSKCKQWKSDEDNRLALAN